MSLVGAKVQYSYNSTGKLYTGRVVDTFVSPPVGHDIRGQLYLVIAPIPLDSKTDLRVQSAEQCQLLDRKMVE